MPRSTFVAIVFALALLHIPINASAATLQAPQKGSLVGWWTFDKGVVTDKVYDRSGRGNHGYFIGGATSSAQTLGKIGQGMSFDGTNDYVQIGSYININGAQSLSFWIKPDQVDGDRVIFISSDGTSNDYLIVTLFQSRVYAEVNDVFSAINKRSNADLVAGSWYHVVVVKSTGNIEKIYVDGQDATEDGFDFSNDNGISETSIGGSDGNPDTDGVIDDVRLYSRALSASEVRVLYRTGAALTKSIAGKGNAPVPKTLDSAGDVGSSGSIAVGRDGFPVISYSDYTNGDLKFAKCEDASCSTTTIRTLDSTGSVGDSTSITIGRDGFPVISYSDWINNDLKFAKCEDASCSTTTIRTLDTTGNVGLNTSITIGRDGYPVISYYDWTNNDLKLAKCGDASCSTTTIRTLDSTGDVGVDTSIAISRDGYPVVSYYDSTNGDLKFAKCGDASCSTTTIRTLDSTIDDVGDSTSITIGRDGYPVIAYRDYTNGDLKFAKCEDASCSTTTIRTLDSTGSVGGYTSIAIGRDGYPVISYYDLGNSDLKFLSCGAYCGSGGVIGKSQEGVVPAGLVGYWSFNGADFTDKIYDRSSQGNHGYAYNVATASMKTTGRIGQGAKFEGVIDAVLASAPTGITGLTQLTACAWVYPLPGSVQFPMIFSTIAGGAGWDIYLDDAYSLTGGLGIGTSHIANAGYTYIQNEPNTTPTVYYNRWSHVCATQSGDGNSNMKLYVNATEVTVDAFASNGTRLSEAGNNVIMGLQQNGTNHYNGKIDEVRVYNRALPVSDIKKLYQAGR